MFKSLALIAFSFILNREAFGQSKPFFPKILREIEAKYGKASTFSAEFTQVNEAVALQQKKLSSGKIYVKRPNKIRWETLKPDNSLFVSDGTLFWFYTPPFDPSEHGQLIQKKSSQVQSKLATALISGSFSTTKHLMIKVDGASQFTLIPKKGTAGTVARAKLFVNLRNQTIQKVILEHTGGNRSEITLHQIELGKPLDDRLFTFTLPPNTDRVEE